MGFFILTVPKSFAILEGSTLSRYIWARTAHPHHTYTHIRADGGMEHKSRSAWKLALDTVPWWQVLSGGWGDDL